WAALYFYRVRAEDASANLGPYSNIVASPSTSVISGPSNLTETGADTTQINLSWTAATESAGSNFSPGILGYLIERCQGVGCANFQQIAETISGPFLDTGLSAGSTYSYRVRAQDTVNALGPYSNVAIATTLTPTITAPSNLAATAGSSTQINVSWTAATETGGTITNYLVERCQGGGCTNFAQVGTSATT